MQFDGFDPMAIPNPDENCTDKELILHKRKVDVMEKQQREGYNRIRVKVKDLRSGYKIAVDKGTRCGSGRLVHENFDMNLKFEEVHQLYQQLMLLYPV